MKQKILKFFVQTTLLLMLLMALYVSFWRESMAVLPDIEVFLGQQAALVLGTDVQIQGARGKLLNFAPHLELDSLTIKHPYFSHNLIELSDLQLKINVWQSLRQRLLVFDGILVGSGELTLPSRGVLERLADKPEFDWRRWANVVMQQKQVTIGRLDVVAGDSKAQLSQGLLLTGSDQVRFQAYLSLKQDGRWLTGDLQGRGQMEMFTNGKGELALKLLGHGINPLVGMPLANKDMARLLVSRVDLLELDVEIRQGQLKQFQGYLQGWATGLNLEFKGRFDEQWQVAAQSRTGAFNLEVGRMIGGWSLSKPMNGNDPWFKGRLPAAHAAELVQTLWPALGPMTATGALQFNWQNAQLQATFVDLTWLQQDWFKQTLVKAGPISGSVIAKAGQGQLQLQSSDFNLELSKVLRQPLEDIQIHDAVIEWHTTKAGLVFTSEQFQLSQADATLQSQWRLTLPLLEKPELSLIAAFQSTSPNTYQQYLPSSMNAGFLSWFDQTIMQGQLTKGQVLFYGTLGELPKTRMINAQRQLQFVFEGSGLDFNYHPDWPILSETTAEVYVESGLVEFTVAGLASALQAGQSPLPVKGSGRVLEQRLELEVQAVGPILAGLDYLLQSPIKDMIEPLTQAIAIDSGGFVSDVKLKLPLGQPQAEASTSATARSVQVQTQLTGVKAQLPMGLALQNLQGQLHFDLDRGLYGDSIKGNLFGREFELSLDKRAAGQTQLDFHGPVPAEALAQWLDWSVLDQVVGEAKVQGQVLMPWDSGSLKLQLHSNLQGFAIGLPGIFGKTAAQQRHWQLDLAVEEGLEFQIEDRDRYLAQLQFQQGQLEKVNLRVGKTTQGLTNRNFGQGWSVELDELDLKLWQALNLWSNHSEFSGQTQQPQLPSWFPVQVRLAVADLHYGEHEFGEFKMSMNEEPSGWRFHLDGDFTKGTGFVPRKSSTPRRVELQSLNLPTSLFRRRTAQNQFFKPQQNAKLQLQNWPALDVDIQAIFALKPERDQPLYLGRLQLLGQPTVGGYTWHEIYGQMSIVHWRGRGDISAQHGSEYQLEISAGRFDRLYENLEVLFDLPKIEPLTAAHLEGQLKLMWPGIVPAPMAISARGQMNFHDGLIRGINGVSPIRWLSLISAERFTRRLQFDFRDFAERGLAYDRLGLDFTLAQGRANQTLQLISPSLELNTKGWIDFSSGQLFQDCVAIIPVLDHLLLPAVATGNLPAAATAFVLDKAFGKSIDALTKVTWQVAGPIQNPTVAPK